VKRAAREKEGRAPMVNLPGSQGVERLRRLSVRRASPRDRGSQSTERKKEKRNRHRPGHNQSGAIIVAAPEREISEPLFFECVFVGRLCQTPIHFHAGA